MPLVSVIIPIYNVEPYLRRCINSVINQTYTNLEIILVDDGSPDGCPAICDEYVQKDNRIKVIHKKNGGLSDARNAGLKIAKGKYITFIDSDDWISPLYIDVLSKNLEANQADISIVENLVTQDDTNATDINTNRTQVMSSKEALHQLFKYNKISFAVSWGKLYKKELFTNIEFPIGKFHEDEFTTYKLFYSARKIVWNSHPLYYYFQRGNSITATRHPYDILEVFEERYLFFKNNGDSAILGYLLPPLCWQLLCAYWYEQKKGNIKDSQKHLIKYKKYIKDFNIVKANIFHTFLLRFFSKFPHLYLLCRKIPFHIRKEF